MNRRHSALAVAALLGITGFGVSYAASAGAAVTGTDTTEPTETTEAEPSEDDPFGDETTEPDETTEAADTEAEATTEAAETTEAVETTEAAETTEVFPEWEPEPIEWSPGVIENTEEGYLEVPIDYANPDDGTLRIFLTRHLALNQSERIGPLLVNPGGPGAAGNEYGTYAEQIFSQEILDRFDVIGFDPRGVGQSEPAIDCIDDYDSYFAGYDITPDDDAERQELVDSAEEFTDACIVNNAAIIQFVGTNNAARDIDSIRRALGEEQLSFHGLSYGSELAATWATMFPETVRAAVLNGASDPDADPLQHTLQQAEGFESTLSRYLAQCSADPGCAFHNDGDAEGAFDQLMLKLDAKPVPSVLGRPDVTRGVALQGVAEAMYYDDYWPQLSEALAAAQQGDGLGLLTLYDQYYRYDGSEWSNLLEAFAVISCADDEERLSVEEEDEQAPLFNEAAPRLYPGTTGAYMCTFFPESIDPRIDITGAGAGTLLVCGTTGDSATPLASTRLMAAALEDARLIVVDADDHTCGVGANECAAAIIDDYLVNLTVPEAEETECPA